MSTSDELLRILKCDSRPQLCLQRRVCTSVRNVMSPLIVVGKTDGFGGQNEEDTEFRIADGDGRRNAMCVGGSAKRDPKQRSREGTSSQPDLRSESERGTAPAG